MSSILPLPKSPIAATRKNPRISLFYGVPKIGKTTETAKLPNCLILDTERGTELLSAMKVPINSISGSTMLNEDGTIAFTSLDSVYDSIVDEGIKEFEKTGRKPRPPYKFLCLDTIDRLEDYCVVSATEKYKRTTIGKNFDGQSVLELPQGGGYYHLRNEVIYQIDRLATICEYLIIISHVKDKVLSKGGLEVSMTDVSLTGKLGQIVCAKADVIGYLYRQPDKPGLQVSFETFENSTMGARVPRLAGKRMDMDWKEIFLDEV